MDNGNKFDWGETARVDIEAPKDFHPGQIVAICGMTKINSEKLTKKCKSNLGDWVYTIEYIGGADKEIPECYLEKYENEDR